MTTPSAITPTEASLITREQATAILLKHMFGGAIGPAKGKSVGYSLFKECPDSFSFLASLEEDENEGQPIDRYLVIVDRVSGDIQPPQLVVLSEHDLSLLIFTGTGQRLATFSRFTDGALSISYKVSVEDDPHVEYVVQLRSHGDVGSMDAIMQLVSSTVDPKILPVPSVYPMSVGKNPHKGLHNMAVQISQFIPGTMASRSYPFMPHEKKLLFVRKVALAFDALWRIPLPEAARRIGELRAHNDDGQIILHVGPDRHHSLGGPFISVADYLRAKIRGALNAFRNQQGIEEYKSIYLHRVSEFVDAGMNDTPAIVEQVPIVLAHSDMGLHNIIVSETDSTDIAAVIDWEFCAVAPYASAHTMIEKFFRRQAPNGFGPEYPSADELRNAFWDSIPTWQGLNRKEATRVFLEWYRFAEFMKAEYRPSNLGPEEKERYWAENVRVVETFLGKYHRL